MSDLNIVRLAVIQLAEVIRDLTCLVPKGRMPTGDFVGDQLKELYERCKQIEAELERP